MKWYKISRFWKSRYGIFRFRLMDINCLAYMALIGVLLLFFHQTVDNWPVYVLIHAAWVMAVLGIIGLAEKYPQRKILSFLRTFYPVVLLLYGWEELEALLPMFYGSYWATHLVVRWDKLIFGVYPTIWVQQWYRPWLDELMSFFYFGYYSFFLLIPLFFLIRKKREETFAVFSIASFTYLSNYILFFLLPALGPRATPMLQILSLKQPTGYLFAEITRLVQQTGGIVGAAFPSSHVAGALVWALAARRYSKKFGYLLAPIALGIGMSTVYLNLHHAVDPICGYIWGALCYFIALRLIKRRGEDPLSIPQKSIQS